jgi:hypothetical protein
VWGGGGLKDCSSVLSVNTVGGGVVGCCGSRDVVAWVSTSQQATWLYGSRQQEGTASTCGRAKKTNLQLPMSQLSAPREFCNEVQ